MGGQKFKDQFKVSGDEQLVMIYNNMSAVFAKQERWDRVLFYAKKANELDAQNTKSKFRMGQAYLQLEDIEKAKELLEQVLALNPEGKVFFFFTFLVIIRINLNIYFGGNIIRCTCEKGITKGIHSYSTNG